MWLSASTVRHEKLIGEALSGFKSLIGLFSEAFSKPIAGNFCPNSWDM